MTTNQPTTESRITNGTRVLLPDGEHGVVQSIAHGEAEVVQWHKTIGRGPWIFPVGQLVAL